MTRTSPLTLALVLTVLLTAGWAAIGWAQLSQLALPDSDDMARLAQIRDWLAGQGFADLTQYRLGGPGGVAMHWSRLPDLVPAGLIALLTPLLGATRAELVAVVFWPEALLLAHLLLAGAIARRLNGAQSIAMLLAALAFPAVALFLPGRIDHHGLQIVLVEAQLLLLLDRRLLPAGASGAASLLVGLETAPVLLALMAALALDWVRAPRPIAGFGLGWLMVTLAGVLLLRPRGWAEGACDSFTPGLFALMLIGGGAWLLLAGLAPRLPDGRWRLGAGFAIALLALACGITAAPLCFASPYGATDPLLRQIWPGAVGEMGGAFAQHPGTVLAWLGLAVAGLLAGIADWRRSPERPWLYPVAAIGVSVLAAFVQIRAGSFGAAVAAPVLAGFVARAQSQGARVALPAWLAATGLFWQALGMGGPGAGRPLASAASARGAGCTDARTLEQLDRLAPGTLAAPIEMGAYALGLTGHKVLAAPYHRNNRGNRAMYDLFLLPVAEARYQATLWTVDYVALCPESFGEVPPALIRPNSLLAALRRGETPEWLEPVLLVGSRANAWRVLPLAGRAR